MPAPVEAPSTTPVINPETAPWEEVYTNPDRICPQQSKELASPDVAP